MSSNIPAIQITDLCKFFHIYESPKDRLKQVIINYIIKLIRAKPIIYYKEFRAIQNINLTIHPGSTVGILGANGAGKSTLLQIIAGTISPTSGEVIKHGRVAAILELGAGFNPDFTGRENARLNALILGLSQEEIESKMPQIEEYADIGDFFDRSVKTYSSGMYSRLAFAVSAHIDPDILIVDEALSVGDTRFQSKCFRTFEQFQNSGKTILFVTHSVDLVLRHCTRAIYLSHGCVGAEGDPKLVVHEYLEHLFEKHTNLDTPNLKNHVNDAITDQVSFLSEDGFESRPGYNSSEFRWGSGSACILDFALKPSTKPLFSNVMYSHELLDVFLLIRFDREVIEPVIGLNLRTPDGVTVAGTNSRDWRGNKEFCPINHGEVLTVKFSFKPQVASGEYLLSFGVAEHVDGEIHPLDRRYDSVVITVVGTNRTSGLADLDISYERIV